MELDFATKESQFMPGVFISHARGTFRDEAEYFMHAFTAMRICKKDLLFPLCLGFFFRLRFLPMISVVLVFTNIFTWHFQRKKERKNHITQELFNEQLTFLP